MRAHAVLSWREPVAVAAAHAHRPGTLWLDSADEQGWSTLLLDPMRVFTGDGVATLRDAEEALERSFARLESGPPFQGGVAGLLGYELGRSLEPVLGERRLPTLGPTLPTVWLGLYRDVVAFDHARRRVHVLCQPWGEGTPVDRLAGLVASLSRAVPPPPAPMLGPVQRDRSPAAHADAVKEIVDRIAEGEVFQVNLSQRFCRLPKAGLSGLDGFALYAALRRVARPAHGAWLFVDPGRWVASVSPERLVSVQGGVASALPIKGTRPRATDPTEDARLQAELASSEKDRAENTMIVDLLRNDLSKVAARGGVTVPRLCAPLTLPTVHHLVSEVRAELRTGVGPVDVVRAVFPGGSITGAPKVQAMRIIQELETARRGPYCGSIGWLSPDGDLDLSIGIRTACPHTDGTVCFSAGGGVVFDSDPEAEERETQDKARTFLELGR